MARNTHKKSSEEPMFVDERPVSRASLHLKTDTRSGASMRRTLQSIYTSENKDRPLDLTKFDRRNGRSRYVLVGLIGFFAVLAGAAWAGFFFFKPYAQSNDKTVSIDVIGPAEVRAGEEATYAIDYRNSAPGAVAALEVRVVVPSSFHVLDTSVAPTSDPYTWTLGSLPAHGNGSLSLHGYFIGPVDNTANIEAIATYRPANFNADFESVGRETVDIRDTVLTGTSTGPAEVAPGMPATYVYKLMNTGTQSFGPFVVSLDASPNFRFKNADPKPTRSGAPSWTIPAIAPAQTVTITVVGMFEATGGGTTPLAFVTTIPVNGTTVALRRDTISTNVAASPLNVGLTVNGVTGSLVASFGETVHAILVYENPGTVPLNDVVLSVVLSADPHGLTNWDVSTANPPARVDNGTFTWTKKELPVLATLAPGAKGTLDVAIGLVGKAPAGIGAFQLRIAGGALISKIGEASVPHQVQTTPVIINLGTDATFAGDARYFDANAAPLGTGPLPPQAGQATVYRVRWSLGATNDPLSAVKVQATLPVGVSWADNANAGTGSINFDKKTQTITWAVGALPTDAHAEFAVSLTPTVAMVGKIVPLVSGAMMTATDSKTGAIFTRRIGELTTELPTDAMSQGKGMVVPATVTP